MKPEEDRKHLDMAEQRPSELPSRHPNIVCTHEESALHRCPNKYVYSPLADSARWIRLLTLHPTGDDADDDAPLHARLWPVARTEAPRFDAVSYTWGQEEATSCIWVEDLGADDPAGAALKCIPIRPNLEKLLKRLRPGTAGVPLWVDALCINQEDHHEKGCQVRHMDEVYRGRQVLIWLGDRSETSDAAIDFIEEWRPVLKRNTSVAESEFMERNAVMTHKWSALWDLIGRPWFTRRWIVQECVLSDHKHVFVGDRHFCWEYLLSLVLMMEKTNRDVGLRNKSNVCSDLECHCSDRPAHTGSHYLSDTPDRIESMKSLHEAYVISHRSGGAGLTLEKLVDDFCGFFSQDPRDGIYAFLSLATDTAGSEWVPDYSPENSVTDVYAHATRHIIRQTGSLDIICRANMQYHSIDFRGHDHSWIPWFGPTTIAFEHGHSHAIHGYRKKSLTTFGQPIHARGAAYRVRRCCHVTCDGCDAAILGVRHKCENCSDFDLCNDCFASSLHDPGHSFRSIKPKSAVYYASGGSRTRLGPEAGFETLRESPHLVLCARGWFADTVSQVGPWINMDRGADGISFGINWSGLPDAKAPRPDEQSDGFFRAITGNRRIVTARGTNGAGEEEISCVPETWVQAVREDWMSGDSVPLSELQKQIMTSLSLMASGPRRYAVTGKSMGFVPNSAEPGDAVCILAGGTVPVVLRKATWLNNDSWVLIGECYIEGVMEGEFMRAMEPSGSFVEPSHISIR